MTVHEFQSFVNTSLSKNYEVNELRSIFKELVSVRLGWDSVDFILAKDTLIHEATRQQLSNDVQRLEAGEPLQYILGKTIFCGLEITCAPSALIPRPETEELVGWILSNHGLDALSVLDVGTGTGCIALALKNARPTWKVSALDCSEEALGLARVNAKNLGLNCDFFYYDLFGVQGNAPLNSMCHIFVSNPPYIPVNEKSHMDSSVKDFEPEIALFVPDEDPLIFYRKILEKFRKYGNEKGWLYLEIHENYAADLCGLLQYEGFTNSELRKDLQGKERMIRVQNVSLWSET